MTLETLQRAGSVAALAVGVFVFASPNYAQTMTTSDTDAVVVAAAPATRQAAEDRSIRPFTVHVPQAELDDLRRRIAATRWPDRKPSTINRKASSWRSCKRSCATGARTTTGARRKRSSMPCRNS